MGDSQRNTTRCITFSPIQIGFTDTEQASRAVAQKIFYMRYNKRTEFSRKTKPQCMNCLEKGHTSNHYKAAMMCPYCADEHPEDKCELRARMKSNCTTCAREHKATNQGADLNLLSSTTPIHLHHSPLDPTCPTRLAIKKKEALQRPPAADQAPKEPAVTTTNRTGNVTTTTTPSNTSRTAAARPSEQVIAGDNNSQMSIAQR